MIYANREVKARWDGKVIEIDPKNPLDLKKYGYADKQISSIEQHFINKHKGLTNIAPGKVEEEKEGGIPCDICEKLYKTETALKTHKTREHKDK